MDRMNTGGYIFLSFFILILRVESCPSLATFLSRRIVDLMWRRPNLNSETAEEAKKDGEERGGDYSNYINKST